MNFWEVVGPVGPLGPNPNASDSRRQGTRDRVYDRAPAFAPALHPPPTPYRSIRPAAPSQTARYTYPSPPAPLVSPASPSISRSQYQDISPYPHPNTLENSHAHYHPVAFRPSGPYYEENRRQQEREMQATVLREDAEAERSRRRALEREEREHIPRANSSPRMHVLDCPPSYSAEASVDWRDIRMPTQDGRFDIVAGRTVPKRPCTYSLPVDDEEKHRLDIGHKMILIAQPGLFLGSAQQVLDPSTSLLPKKVLDIGTGNGSWALAVAERYRSAEVLGVDLVPIQPRDVPPNVKFGIQDVNRGLSFNDAEFDLVHARNVQLGIPDYRKFIEECARVLKPGGLVNLIEGDWDIFDCDGKAITPYKNPGWFNWIQVWRAAVMQRNIEVDAPEKASSWLKESPYFSDLTVDARWMPIGPWTNDPTQNELGEVVWENLKYLVPSIRPVLSEYYHGNLQIADKLIQHAWAELASPNSHVFMRWRFLSARRNARMYTTDGPKKGRRNPGKGKEKAR